MKLLRIQVVRFKIKCFHAFGDAAHLFFQLCKVTKTYFLAFEFQTILMPLYFEKQKKFSCSRKNEKKNKKKKAKTIQHIFNKHPLETLLPEVHLNE